MMMLTLTCLVNGDQVGYLSIVEELVVIGGSQESTKSQVAHQYRSRWALDACLSSQGGARIVPMNDVPSLLARDGHYGMRTYLCCPREARQTNSCFA